MAINEVRLDGRIGKDPDSRFTGSGDRVLNFSVAFTNRKKQGDEWVNGTTDWYNVEYWPKNGETTEKFVKGAYICLRGRLKTDSWEKDGQKQTRIKIAMTEVESWEFVKGGKSGADANSGSKPAQSKPAPAQESDFDPHAYEDDIPFS